jgi:orotate phosphoribosyltransferase
MDLLNLLEQKRGLLDGHFVLSAGDHSPKYLCVDPLLCDPRQVYELCAPLLSPFRHKGVTTVVSPAIGGIVLCQAAALWMTLNGSIDEVVYAAWADKTVDGGFDFERWGFAFYVGEEKRVIIAEDVVTSGRSTRQVREQVERHGGVVVGVAALFNRGTGVTAETLGVPLLHSLRDVSLPKYPANTCPLCRDRQPIVVNPALGHGQLYQKAHPDYKGGYIELQYAA